MNRQHRFMTLLILIVVISALAAILVGCTPTSDTLRICLRDGREVSIEIPHKSIAYTPNNQLIRTDSSVDEITIELMNRAPSSERAEVVTLDGVSYVNYYAGSTFMDSLLVMREGDNTRIEEIIFVPNYLYSGAKSDDHIENSVENNAYMAVFGNRSLLKDARTYTLTGAKYDDSFLRLKAYLASIDSIGVTPLDNGTLQVAVDGKYIFLKEE